MDTGQIRYEFETGTHDELTYVSAVLNVPDRRLWPTVRPSTEPGVTLDVNFSNSFKEVVVQDMRTAEGILSLFGLESIDVASAEEEWLPDSEDERRDLELFGVKRTFERRPVQSYPYTEFDLVARAFLAASEGREVETGLSFFRKGRADVLEGRYIEAVFDFLFLLESLHARGKFKTDQVLQIFLADGRLQDDIAETLRDEGLLANMSREPRAMRNFEQIYAGRSPAEITKHLVDLRGFIHHHSKDRPDIWHPEDHWRFAADAFFLQHLCFAIAFRLVKPLVFSKEREAQYLEQLSRETS